MRNNYRAKGSTIAQYKIMRWINSNFTEKSVDVIFDSPASAIVSDDYGERLYLQMKDGRIEVTDAESVVFYINQFIKQTNQS